MVSDLPSPPIKKYPSLHLLNRPQKGAMKRARCASSHSAHPTQPHASLSDSRATPSEDPHHPRPCQEDGLRMSCRTLLCSLCWWCKRRDCQHRVRANPRLTGSIERELSNSALLAAERMPVSMGTRSGKSHNTYAPAEAAIALGDLDLRERPAPERQGHGATMTTTMIDLLVRFVGFKVQAVEDGLDIVWAPGSRRFAVKGLSLSQEGSRIRNKFIVMVLALLFAVTMALALV